MQYRWYQQKLDDEIEASWARGNRNVCAVMSTGAGKCLGAGTPVLLHDGVVKLAEQIEAGDFLMGPDGTARLVVSTTSGYEMMYRVTPTKGEPYEVNESHILSLRRTGESSKSKHPSRNRSGEIVNVSVLDYLSRSDYWRHVHKGWRSGAVEFGGLLKDTTLPLPPYILGVWLGDGTSTAPQICNVDQEVLNEWIGYAESIGHLITKAKVREDQVPTHSVRTVEGKRAGRNHVTLSLRRLNLIRNKHVPHEYKTASIPARRELLAGVIDTDGYLSKGGYDIVVKQEAFARDIVFVARSLGLAAYVKECTKTCTNTGVSGQYWRLSINGNIDQIPCRVPRRQASPRAQKKDVTNTGIKVDPIGVGEYHGFEIAGPDRLFLLGDFTVTHNSIVMANKIRQYQHLPSILIAHRKELVSQLALALGANGVRHKVIGPTDLTKFVIARQKQKLGTDFYDPNSQCAVAAVDTLIRRQDRLRDWAQQVRLWMIDECHHILVGNKWGTAVSMFDNAHGLGVTATPVRADGKGLGAHSDGVLHDLVEGPTMRQLINEGYLSDYRIVAPLSDLHVDPETVGKSGDYSSQQLRKAAKKSRIVGDVAENYLRYAKGMRTIVFGPDVETATEMSLRMKELGIRAEVLSGTSANETRATILDRFEKGEVDVLVNVDLFGEGFDVPAVECVIMARPTESYGLYSQVFGRALRPWPGKEKALIIDHVGAVERHGLPDKPRVWSLDGREKTPKAIDPDDDIPVRYCQECTQPYERFMPYCPYCGHEHVPESRSSPDQVDGDLVELSEDALRRLRGEVVKNEEDPYSVMERMRKAGVPRKVFHNAYNKITNKQQAQQALQESMAWWGGFHSRAGRSDREIMRRFYHRFGMDVLTARTLNREESLALAEKINHDILRIMP